MNLEMPMSCYSAGLWVSCGELGRKTLKDFEQELVEQPRRALVEESAGREPREEARARPEI